MKPYFENGDTSADGEEAENLSWSLSITNVPNDVYDDENSKELFEKLFSPYGSKSDRSFIYLKSFHRVRVTFSNEENAKKAKKDLHGQLFLGYELGAFLVQRRSSPNSNNSNLMPPPLTKQFLISPPASPPVGWEQSIESHPVINYDLLAAVASLDISEPYQLHTSQSADNAPSIVVHLCDEDERDGEQEEGSKVHPLKLLPREVTQTRRPDRKI